MDPKKTLEQYVGASLATKIFGGVLLAATVLMLLLGLTAGNSSDQEMWFVFTGICAILLLIPVVYILMPVTRLNKCLRRLEETGELEKAAAALSAPDACIIGKNVGRVSGGYLYGKGTGMVVRVADVIWLYKFVQRTYFIPTNASLMVTTADHNKIPAVIFGRNDKNQELEQAMLQMHKQNPNILLGFTRENQKAANAARKAVKLNY